MKKVAIAAFAVLMCGVFISESAFAHRSRTRIGISIGVPLVGFGYGYGGYYPSPYHYRPYYPYPSYYSAPVQPPVYLEQGQPPAAAYWYFCAESRAYYPHVRECASGWQRVAPQPG